MTIEARLFLARPAPWRRSIRAFIEKAHAMPDKGTYHWMRRLDVLNNVELIICTANAQTVEEHLAEWTDVLNRADELVLGMELGD